MNKMFKNAAIFTIVVIGGFVWSNIRIIKTIEGISGEKKEVRYHTCSASSYENTVFGTRSEALELLYQIQDIIVEYGSVSVADVRDLLGDTPGFTDYKYGWTRDDLRTGRVIKVRYGYMLKLPEPSKIV